MPLELGFSKMTKDASRNGSDTEINATAFLDEGQSTAGQQYRKFDDVDQIS